MNAPLDAEQRAQLEAALSSVTLDDKYTLEAGRAYMKRESRHWCACRCCNASATRPAA